MNIKKISVVLLALLLTCTVASCGKKDDNVTDGEEKKNTSTDMVYQDTFTYGVSGEGTYEITGYLYAGTEPQNVVIPAEIDGREVTGIGKDAFKAFKTVTSITIPESITYIGQYAFYDCDGLTSVVIPNSVTAIGEGAFRACDKLASITLPTGLKSIDKYTFMDCTVLGNVTLPAGLESIGAAAFWNCDAFTEVTIPVTVKDLGDAAFYECSKLAKVTALGEALGKTEVNAELDEDDEDRYTYHPIGEIIFKSCADNLMVYVTADTELAKYAQENKYNVQAAPAVVGSSWTPNA